MKQDAICQNAFEAAGTSVGSASLCQPVPDGRIEESFKETYVYQTYLKGDAVKVSAKNGAAVLSGTVPDESYKALAQETVTNLPGVVSVDNQLSTAAEVAAVNADTWIGRKVKFSLLFHRNVTYSKTIVDVLDGFVTLKGEATSAAQKELTTEYAKDIDGVKDVNNEMTVAVAPELEERTVGDKIDDASVIAQVKAELRVHRSTSSMKTRVEARNGEVTLTGIARNAAEKALITKLVVDIHGVTSVKNLMTVGEIRTK
ncbi:MAG TPA: transport-associated protein [Lentisphaeria bacterium]|nr:MAG: hypothetical protein A2X45_05245 [Lentisphaerae bacterium GWF2_50_93]HCE44901.1 transport-associated protein [Lentisphaeria bacterium]